MRTFSRLRILLVLVVASVILSGSSQGEDAANADQRQLLAGAAALDVTPIELPVIINGGMTERVADRVEDRLHARALVLDDGTTSIALVVVDNCMMPRELLDEAKSMASKATGIPAERMLISATHTHSAPSVHGCLGSDVDRAYASFLPGQIAKAVEQAHRSRVPAQIGWAVGRDEKNVGCRRWLMRPGTAPTNPFSGKANDLAQMHPGFDNPNALRPTGPVDPDVSVLAVRTRDGGHPIAVLANYSMHYVGAPPVSGDYFGIFCRLIEEELGADGSERPMVGILSNGTSGDTWLMDYTKSRREFDRFTVAQDVAQVALETYRRIEFQDWVPITMKETLLTLDVRMPSAEEVAKAKEFAKAFEDRKPKDVPEVYARETILLSEMPPTRELKLQAIRIGDLGITGIPNEVFAVTGLTIKRLSPLATTFNISLANGAEGYIPPPDQHALGGYETWRARTSCLEVNAEPKIAAAVVDLLRELAE